MLVESGTPAIDNSLHPAALDFLWLELTNQCNLQCMHCYSESSPSSTEKNLLDEDSYKALITDAFDLGCHRIQFIGGEPTLNKSLAALIAHADGCGYEFIEVFTNLVSLPQTVLDVFLKHRVAVATSVYANTPALHDKVTQTLGSHDKTIRNIKRVLDAGLHVRASVIAMEQNSLAITAAVELLREIGVSDVGLDHVRGFGRGQLQSICSMESLCGNCANNILAIGPDGIVAPCIMSKSWAVGSVRSTPFKTIALSDQLLQTRRHIAQATSRKLSASWPGPPNPCQPDRSCTPNCSPSSNCSPCSPYSGQPCQPNRWCNPTK